MKKIVLIISSALIAVGIIPAQAAETRTVTNVSAYYRADLGYMVGWTLPSDTKGITSYTVTANPTGQTCVASGATNVKCVFTTAQLGFTNNYIFTVSANSSAGVGVLSQPSNSIKAASIPYAPEQPLAKLLSDTDVDIAWVPNTNDGGVSLYGYKVNVWESLPNGDPGTVALETIATKANIIVTNLKPSTLYVINVASCNAYGCNSANKWTYISTAGTLGVSAIKPPTSLSGGTPSTSCWNWVLDAGNAASAGTTITKNTYTCASATVDPSMYPVIVPSATMLPGGNLATKFAQSASFSGFAKSYSISAWSATGGNTWSAYLSASSKSPVVGFTINPIVSSTTPAVCQINNKLIKFIGVGTCNINATIGENNIWKAAPIATASFQVVL